MGALTLVTGGARSGKSAFAETLALRAGRTVTYVATLTPLDDEMHDRVARHRERRPADWRTVEADGDLAAAAAETPGTDLLLLDCLAVWASDRLLALRDETPSALAVARVEEATAVELARFLAALAAREGPSIVVTNEVGDGVVPPYPLGRAYRDLLGRLNQQASRAAADAYLVVAGRPLALPPPFEAPGPR